jgi:hypothetical protein
VNFFLNRARGLPEKAAEEKKIMKTMKWLRNLVLGLALVCAAQSAAYAVQAVATVGTNNSAPNVVYMGGLNGNLNIVTNNAFLRSTFGFGFNPNVTVQFSTMVGIPGTYVFNGDGVWHLWVRDPNNNPVNFVVFDNANGNVLLRGSFQRAILHGRSGSSSLAITLPADNANYSQNSLALPDGANLMNGSFSVAVLSQVPVGADPAAGPAAFNANGDINFGID